MATDWVAWHEQYSPGSSLADRLVAVQAAIRPALVPGCRVVSACAGDGRDLLGVLDGRSDVTGRLVELDPSLAAAARAAAPPSIEVVTGDAGVVDAYAGAVPADLVLLCGVFGNVPDVDVRATVAALPQLCAPGATVVWTRHRRPPDLTPSVRSWFADTGFDEVSFVGDSWSVGSHRFAGDPEPLRPGTRLFSFS